MYGRISSLYPAVLVYLQIVLKLVRFLFVRLKHLPMAFVWRDMCIMASLT